MSQIQPNDIKGRANEIEMLVAQNSLDKAVKRLLDYVGDFSEERDQRNNAIVISANYHNIETSVTHGKIDWDRAQKERTKIMFQVLDLTQSILEQKRSPYAG